MPRTRIAIECFDNPAQVLVNQPDEPEHRKEVAANTSYEFEVNNGATIKVGALADEEVHSDSVPQKPTPEDKPHKGQTSGTSELQPEPDSTTAKREKGDLPDDADVLSGSLHRRKNNDAAWRAQDQPQS